MFDTFNWQQWALDRGFILISMRSEPISDPEHSIEVRLGDPSQSLGDAMASVAACKVLAEEAGGHVVGHTFSIPGDRIIIFVDGPDPNKIMQALTPFVAKYEGYERAEAVRADSAEAWSVTPP